MTATASRTAKSNRTRERILDAAAHIFRVQGYAGARLGDIAARAGLRTGALYYHFASKDELVEEVLRLGVQHSREFVNRRVQEMPAEATALDRLAAAVEGHVLTVLERGDYTSANIRIFGQVPEDIRQRHLDDQRAYGRDWHRLLLAAQQSGELRPDVDLSVVRMLMLGALNWTAEWYEPDPGRVTVEEVARQAVAMFFEGLGAGHP